MEKLHFKVAGIQFAILSHDNNFIKKLLPSYAPFHVEAEGDSNLVVEVDNSKVDPEPLGCELGHFDCGGANHSIYRLHDGGYKILISTVDDHLASAMITSSDFKHCTVSLYGDLNDNSFGLRNAMMIAFSFSSAQMGVLLMHASVIMHQNKGYLFLGKSGTGKSTHTQLWLRWIEGSELLNDDNPAVRLMPNGEVLVFGTPWSGKTPCYKNKQCPVGGFVRLEQYGQNLIEQLTPLRAFGSILSSCSTMMWDKPSYTHITQTVDKVAQTVPAYHLRCLPNQEAAELSQRTISKP